MQDQGRGTEGSSSDPTEREILSEEQYSLIFEDPFAFYVIQIIQVGNVRSIASLNSLLPSKPGLQDRLRPLLRRMEDLGLITIQNDEIRVHKNNFRFRLSAKAQGRLFPALFELAAERAVRNIDQGEDRPMIFMVSEDPVTRQEIREAFDRFRSNLREIGQNVRNRPNPDGARIVGLVTAPMLGQDFLAQSETMNCPESWSPREARTRLRQITQAAHDIRPALAGLKVIRHSLSAEGSELQELLESIIARLERISEDFLPIHERKLGFRPAECVQLVSQLFNEFRTTHGRISWELELPSAGVLHAKIVERDLERILLNLLGNSVEALQGKSDAKIVVALREYASVVEIAVRDNGPGISDEVLECLEKGATASSKVQGVGLGVSGAKRSVEAAGGHLTFNVNNGTEVRMQLPRIGKH